mmetsp:Transcript_28767/g.25463  ORF Transcript_28767/g.25463 Transcript_28767/m.25463 type:complete len:120 (-) Transcript_28767:37-396(-)
MLLSHVESWDPNKIPGVGEELNMAAANVAVVVDGNNQVPVMDPFAGQNPYLNQNGVPNNDQQMIFNPPPVIIMEPMPMNPAQMMNPVNPVDPEQNGEYVPYGPAATPGDKGGVAMGMPV